MNRLLKMCLIAGKKKCHVPDVWSCLKNGAHLPDLRTLDNILFLFIHVITFVYLSISLFCVGVWELGCTYHNMPGEVRDLFTH